MTNLHEYQNEIGKETEISQSLDSTGTGQLTGSFTAGASFKKTESLMRNQERGFATASSQCTLFSIAYAIPPCLSEELELHLSSMSDIPTENEINQFIDTFGTHAIRKVNMGARFVSTATYDIKEAKE